MRRSRQLQSQLLDFHAGTVASISREAISGVARAQFFEAVYVFGRD